MRIFWCSQFLEFMFVMGNLNRAFLSAALIVLCSHFAGCGGGGNASSPTPAPAPQITDAVRIKAATDTIANNTMCSVATLGSYYWEIGDANGTLASGTVGTGGPTANTMMLIYSASKWLYASSVVQLRGVQDSDAGFLNFTSGWSKFGNQPFCLGNSPTVDNCPPGTSKNMNDPITVERFAYDSGHMQYHASAMMGLGSANTTALAAQLNANIGNFRFSYNVPQLAAGVQATPSIYSKFLRLLVQNRLRMADALGSRKVCAQSQAPGCNAAYTPDSIGTEQWNYSLGHWVEDDPILGDHAYSSAGGGGFYPWIDVSKTYYGVVARERQNESAAGFHSAQCGRLVRQAWVTGQQVFTLNPVPVR
jgi:hypothetical protein